MADHGYQEVVRSEGHTGSCTCHQWSASSRNGEGLLSAWRKHIEEAPHTHIYQPDTGRCVICHQAEPTDA